MIKGEIGFTDTDVNDGLLVDTIFDLTSLRFLDGLLDIESDGTSLWIWHQTFRTEQASELTKFWHVSWGRNENVEIDDSLFKLLDEFGIFSDVSTSGLSFFAFIFWSEDGDTNSLTITVWKNDGGANVLVSLAWIDTKASVNFDSSIEFSWVGFDSKLDSIGEAVSLSLVDILVGSLVFFTTAFKN